MLPKYFFVVPPCPGENEKLLNSISLSCLGDYQFYWILKINAQVKNIILIAVFVYAYMFEYD